LFNELKTHLQRVAGVVNHKQISADYGLTKWLRAVPTNIRPPSCLVNMAMKLTDTLKAEKNFSTVSDHIQMSLHLPPKLSLVTTNKMIERKTKSA